MRDCRSLLSQVGAIRQANGQDQGQGQHPPTKIEHSAPFMQKMHQYNQEVQKRRREIHNEVKGQQQDASGHHQGFQAQRQGDGQLGTNYGWLRDKISEMFEQQAQHMGHATQDE